MIIMLLMQERKALVYSVHVWSPFNLQYRTILCVCTLYLHTLCYVITVDVLEPPRDHGSTINIYTLWVQYVVHTGSCRIVTHCFLPADWSGGASFICIVACSVYSFNEESAGAAPIWSACFQFQEAQWKCLGPRPRSTQEKPRDGVSICPLLTADPHHINNNSCHKEWVIQNTNLKSTWKTKERVQITHTY